MLWIKISCTRHSDSTTHWPCLGATGTHMDVVKSEWPNSGWGGMRWCEDTEPRFVLLHDKLTFQSVGLGTVIYSAKYKETSDVNQQVFKEKYWPWPRANPPYHKMITISLSPHFRNIFLLLHWWWPVPKVIILLLRFVPYKKSWTCKFDFASFCWLGRDSTKEVCACC